MPFYIIILVTSCALQWNWNNSNSVKAFREITLYSSYFSSSQFREQVLKYSTDESSTTRHSLPTPTWPLIYIINQIKVFYIVCSNLDVICSNLSLLVKFSVVKWLLSKKKGKNWFFQKHSIIFWVPSEPRSFWQTLPEIRIFTDKHNCVTIKVRLPNSKILCGILQIQYSFRLDYANIFLNLFIYSF